MVARDHLAGTATPFVVTVARFGGNAASSLCDVYPCYTLGIFTLHHLLWLEVWICQYGMTLSAEVHNLQSGLLIPIFNGGIEGFDRDG